MNRVREMMFTLLVAGTLSSSAAVLLSEDFETYSAGDKPVATRVSAAAYAATGENFVTVTDSSTNTAGSGMGVHIRDNDVSGTALEWEYGTTESAVKVSFDFAQLSFIADNNDAIRFGLGQVGETLGAGARRYAEAAVYDDGNVRVYFNGSSEYVDTLTTNVSHNLTLFANDSDTNSVTYTGPDSNTYTLPTNSIAWWYDDALILNDGAQYGLLDVGEVTAGGTVGTTDGNLNRVGFVSSTTGDLGMNYVFDNITVSTIEASTNAPGPQSGLVELIAEDFESGQTVGLPPSGATTIRPSSPDVTCFTYITDSSTNSAGTGNGAHIYDYKSADGCMLTYNFVASTNDQLSAVRIDFDFAPLSADGAGDDYIAVGVGDYSTDKTLNSSTRRWIDARLYNDGTIDFINGAGGTYSSGNVLQSDSNSISIFINDYDSQSIAYTGMDDNAYTLPSNSVAYWLNGSLVDFGGDGYTPLDVLELPAGGGAIGTSEGNLGKFGFNTGTSDTNLSYVIDNIAVYEIVESVSANSYSSWLAFYPALGSSTNMADDAESDGMNNLLEYALGSDPTVDDAAGFLPVSGLTADSGTNWLSYVYIRRLDAAERGLTYSVLGGTSLADGGVTNATEEVGSAAIDAAFESVTNRLPVLENTGFMKLEIELAE